MNLNIEKIENGLVISNGYDSVASNYVHRYFATVEEANDFLKEYFNKQNENVAQEA